MVEVLKNSYIQKAISCHLDHFFCNFAKSRENLLKFENIKICYFLRKLENSIFFISFKNSKKCWKIWIFYSAKNSATHFFTSLRNKKISAKLVFLYISTKSPIPQKYFRKENYCYEFYTLQSKWSIRKCILSNSKRIVSKSYI